MSRVIDADVMLAELKPITYEMEHSVVTIADMSNIMRNWVERQPTLTPPNEPLTCEGCYWKTNGSFGKCIDCIRGNDKDNYRLPPERQDDTDA